MIERVQTWRLRAALLVCVACLVGCDRASKLAAEVALRDRAGPLLVVPGVVDLSYSENRDVAFNALARLSLQPPVWMLTAFAVVASIAILAVWLRRRRPAWPDQVGFALVCAGALGNAIDRLALGHVVDFIHVHHWPVFNVADALIVAGAAALVLARWRRQVVADA
jgi:signal peptidase II